MKERDKPAPSEPARNAHKILPTCTSCEDCVGVCPTGSIFYGANQYVIDSATCHGCAICVSVCLIDCIRPVAEVAQDQVSDEEEDAS